MKWLRDWWRGWADGDLASILRKVEHQKDYRPGEIIPVTLHELRAHLAYCHDQHPKLYIKA